MIRICPDRDATCLNGMNCDRPCATGRYGSENPMTDTVNVLREVGMEDAPDWYCHDAASGWANGWNACRDAFLAAAPKDEPIRDPYKLDLTAVIQWLENGCDTAHAITELKIYQARLSAQPLSNPQQLEDRELNMILTGYRNLDDTADKDAVIAHLCDLLEARPDHVPDVGKMVEAQKGEPLKAMIAAITKVAMIAEAWGDGAGEPSIEIAGGIVAYLAANPSETETFLVNPSMEQSLAACRPENWCLTWRAQTGEIMDREMLADYLAKNKGPQ